METRSQIFDFESDRALYRSLRLTLERIQSSNTKETKELLYLLIGTNHLRDWIAPNFDWKDGKPATIGQEFGQAIYNDLPEFQIVNALCNRSKHMGKSSKVGKIEVVYGALIDAWPDFDSVESIDNGPPVRYLVNGRDLLKIIEVVLDYYESNWYKRSTDNQSGCLA